MRNTTLATMLCLAALLVPVSVAYPAGPGPEPGKKLSYADLAGRLIDLERLSVLPVEGERCMQWSSYDRRSKYDAKTGTYVDWGANGDGSGIIRKEGDVEVIAEMTGPGCIWRIWSALATQGHVKIYLDGAAEPTIDLPFDDYFNGKVAPFVYPSLVHTTARGRNNYVPIPFAKSCKIVAEPKWGRYYQFVYSVFPKGTQVPTFRMELTDQETLALKVADTILTKRLGTDPAGERKGLKTESGDVLVAPGKTATVADLAGPRAVTAIRVKLPAFADREEEMAALRALALKITWDGADRPQVWSPLGDFFGTAPGINPHKSLPLGLSKEGGYCFWYMPFGTSARIELANDDKTARKLTFQISHAPLRRPMAQLGYFHAKWHRDALLPEDPARRAIDWTMLRTTGRGRFCGVMLHVWNPRGGWWGEGDEKFFVDGEKFPSTIGTGSEDYFGYAWCNPTLFQNAYHNQTISQGNRGHASLNRFHITDNIPFQKCFDSSIEKYYPNKKPTLYAAIAYWYQAGGKDPYGPVPADQRWGYCIKPQVFTVKGAIEGEKLRVLACTGGRRQRQDMSGFTAGKWSDDCHLWWMDGKVGDKLTLAVPVKTAGRYEVKVRLTKAIDYGIFQFSVNSAKAGQPIDLYHDGVIPTKEISLGTFALKPPAAKLTAEVTGKNPKAVNRRMFGLDYVKLEPAK